MMKRNILAVVIPALLAAGAANAAEIYNKDGNKLDLYGKAVGLHYFSHHTDAYAADGDHSYGRLGFKGQTQINDQLTGYGQWEYQFNFNNSEGADAQNGNKTRLGFAGLKTSNYGSIDYGRNYAVVYDVLGLTDMLPEFGGDTAFSDKGVTGGRTTGVLTWRNTNFFGLVDGWNFAAQYQGKNDRTELSRANGEGYGVSTSYHFPVGVSIVGAYGANDRTSGQAAGGIRTTTHADKKTTLSAGGVGAGSKAERWAAGVKYDANNIYLAAIYSEARNAFDATVKGTDTAGNSYTTTGFANKAQTIELVAQYQFGFGLRPSLGYVQTKAKDVEGVGDADLIKYWEVGATYYFNKNMSAYVDYLINQINNNNKLGAKTGDTVAVGLVYQF